MLFVCVNVMVYLKCTFVIGLSATSQEMLSTAQLSWPVVVDTETQVDVRWETTSAVVSFGDGCGRLAGLLDSKSDCCVMDEIVLDLEMSQIVSV